MNTRQRRKTILERLAQEYPTAETELMYGNNFQLLIAVVMSAQTTDRAVNKVTTHLFQIIYTPEDVIRLGFDALAQAMQSIGLWRAKALNIMKLSHQLIERHAGHVPNTRDALCALAGVGSKTAAVVLNVAFGEPTVAVDTHVFRLAHRMGLARGKTPDLVEQYFNTYYTKSMRTLLHHRLILHGRYICKARKPLCFQCVLCDICPSRDLYVA